MSLFEAVVDTLCKKRLGILYLNQMKMMLALLALQLDPNRRDEERTWRMDGGVKELGRKTAELHTSGAKRAEPRRRGIKRRELAIGLAG